MTEIYGVQSHLPIAPDLVRQLERQATLDRKKTQTEERKLAQMMDR